MGKINNDLRLAYCLKYPNIELCSDKVFDTKYSYESYIKSIVDNYVRDYSDIVIRLASDQEYPEVQNWLEKCKSAYKNNLIDFLVGIEKDTHDFFVIMQFECEEGAF